MPTLRKIERKDEPHIIELFSQLTTHEVIFDIQSLIQDDNCHCLVMESGEGRVIGFGALIVHRTPTKGHVARLEDIVVHQEFRGQGLERSLVVELVEIAKQRGIKHINLTSNPNRIAARKLYQSLGFNLKDTGVFHLEL